ncbi:ChaN family lipoprotein [Diaphorobacter sp. HDW4A]|uniref:ChaN family lipoprotein n=1 Tax=Diaphorobacter sp. HDW4A TaxID=2714924 RepID=UPI00140D6A17|nr:ChaN family lipoprotein [Diaphorobacter sp. HDW4A]QIL82007.1 ChaN family lipoprotein [Diaphorobacter sp. HDW4A]
MILISKHSLTRSTLSVLTLSTLLLSACSLPIADRVSQSPELHWNSPTAQTQWHETLTQIQSAPVILLGEQHDAPEHHAIETDTVRELAARGKLAALVMEMADAGVSTSGLPTNASEAEVQNRLNWNDKGWPWKSYGPTVMAAVRANIPVLGGNLPRGQMANTMKNAHLDQHLDAKAMQIQINTIKEGHCNLLPETQLQPMTRIQLARDESMARVVASAVTGDRTVLLVAGHGHVRTRVGVPTWLPRDLPYKAVIAQAGQVKGAIKDEADIFIVTHELPQKDHCAELRERFKR